MLMDLAKNQYRRAPNEADAFQSVHHPQALPESLLELAKHLFQLVSKPATAQLLLQSVPLFPRNFCSAR
jgi:hypothetical protein